MKKNQKQLKNDVAFKEHSATHQAPFTPDGPSEVNDDSNTKGPQEVTDVEFEDPGPGSLIIRVNDEDRKEGEKKYIHESAILFNRVAVANVTVETFAKNPFEAKKKFDRKVNFVLTGDLQGFHAEDGTSIDLSTPEGMKQMNEYLDKMNAEDTEERRKKSVAELRSMADKIESGEQDPVTLQESPFENIFQKIMQKGI